MDSKKSEYPMSLDSDYPTEQQMEECFAAWKENGEEGLLKYLLLQESKAATKQ